MKDFRKPKLIISDLDGTLIAYGSDMVSAPTKAAVARLKMLGVAFTLATGRSWRQTRKIARELQVNLPVILQAGAIIFDPVAEKTIRVRPLRTEIEVELRKIAPSRHFDRLCLDKSGIYYATTLNTRGGQRLMTGNERCVVGGTTLPVTGSIIKHLFIGSEADLTALVDRIQTLIKPMPNCVLWPPDSLTTDWFLEVFDPLATKGQALEWLTHGLGIKREEVIAFGDGYNDLDMLNWAGQGVAVETAPTVIKRAADRLMPGPEKHGAARFIDKYFEKC